MMKNIYLVIDHVEITNNPCGHSMFIMGAHMEQQHAEKHKQRLEIGYATDTIDGTAVYSILSVPIYT